jgi:hypothetical protein
MAKTVSIDEIRKRKASSCFQPTRLQSAPRRPSPDAYVILLDEGDEVSSISRSGTRSNTNQGRSSRKRPKKQATPSRLNKKL